MAIVALENNLGTFEVDLDEDGWKLMVEESSSPRHVLVQNRTNDSSPAVGDEDEDAFDISFRSQGDVPGSSEVGIRLLHIAEVNLLTPISSYAMTTRLAVYVKRVDTFTGLASVTILEEGLR